MDIITIERLKETATYRELVSKKEQVKINILEQRIVRSELLMRLPYGKIQDLYLQQLNI